MEAWIIREIRIVHIIARIEYFKLFWGLEFCSTVFRNPRGAYQWKDEYFLLQRHWIYTFFLGEMRMTAH